MDAAASATHLVPHADPADVTRLQKSLDNAVDTDTPEKRLDTKPAQVGSKRRPKTQMKVEINSSHRSNIMI